MKNIFIVIIIIMIILCGCVQQGNVLLPSPKNSPDSKANTQIATPLRTLTPTYTSTIALTQIPGKTPTVDLTQPIFRPYLNLSNQDAFAIIAQILATTPPRVQELSVSPDQKWRVELINYGCTCTQCEIPVYTKHSFDVLRLVQVANSEVRQISSQLNLCWWVGNGLNEVVWSLNSSYFYFTDAYEDNSGERPSRWTRNFYQYDINSQIVYPLGPGVLSPDRKALATSEQLFNDRLLSYPKAFIVWDLNGHKIFRFDTHYSSGSSGEHHIAWSPITPNLVYIETECHKDVSCVSRLYYVDRLTGTRSMFLQKNNLSIIGVYWDEPGRLLLIDNHYQQWTYSFADNDIIQKHYEK